MPNFKYTCLVTTQRDEEEVPEFCMFFAPAGEVLQWAAIERIAFRPGKMKIFPVRGRKRTYNNYVGGSGFGVLCRLLVELGISASFDPTG